MEPCFHSGLCFAYDRLSAYLAYSDIRNLNNMEFHVVKGIVGGQLLVRSEMLGCDNAYDAAFHIGKDSPDTVVSTGWWVNGHSSCGGQRLILRPSSWFYPVTPHVMYLRRDGIPLLVRDCKELMRGGWNQEPGS